MFAILCGTGSLLVMTPRWQVLSEVTLPEPAGGSAGCLAWRPDAQYIAVSTQDADSGDRIVRVLTNDLNLHAEGRNENNSGVPDLYPVLAWSTDSELVGSVQRVREHMQVVFFERNGLRHGEFILSGVNPDALAPTSLQWNSTCDLLAVHLDPVAPAAGAAGATASQVQLWQRDNYHWACKLHLHEPAPAAGAAPALGCVSWDSEVAFRLRYVAGASHVRQVDMDLSSSTSGGPCTLATNVQGGKVGLTPLAYMLTPPPSCYVQLQFPSNVMCASYEPLQDGPASLSMAPELPARECTPSGTAGLGDAGGFDSMLAHLVLPVTGDNRLAVVTSDGALRVVCTAVAPPRHPLARAGCGVLRPSDAGNSAVLACNAQGEPQKAVDAPAPLAGVCDVQLQGFTAVSAPGAGLPDTPLHLLRLRQLTWLEAHTPRNAGESSFQYVFVAVAAAPAPAVGDWLVQLTLSLKQCDEPEVHAVVFPVPLGTTSLKDGCAISSANGTVVRVAAAAAAGAGGCVGALVHTTDCAVWRWEGGSQQAWMGHPHCVLPEVCTHITALRPTGTGTGAMLALNTLSSRLYLNHVLLCPAATSMALHWMPGKGIADGKARTAQFLFYTTLGPTPSLACVSEHTLHLLLQAAPAPAAVGAGGHTSPHESVTTVLRAESAAAPAAAGAALGIVPPPDAPPTVSAAVSAEVAAAGAWDSAAARTVERGALLVAVTPGGTRVVLQLPRGNFEGTHPRVLTLTLVRHLVDARQYGAAVEVCRRHRIDMALLPAHDEDAFMAWAPVALSQLPPTAHDRWDLLLTALGAAQGGVQSKYPPPPGYAQPAATPPLNVNQAVWARALSLELDAAPLLPFEQGGGLSHATRVCCAVRAAVKSLHPGITSSSPGLLLKTVLSSYARQVPADVGAALAVVQAVMQAGKGPTSAADSGAATGAVLAGWTPPATPPLSPTVALKHLALLVTPDELWAASLRTYDLALMHMVAHACGRDPKKTEPFLRRLVQLAAQLPAHACYAVAAELKDAGAACRWAAGAAAASVPGDDLLQQWGVVTQALDTLLPGAAMEDARELGRALSQRGAPHAEWLLRLDGVLPPSLPSHAGISRAWRLEGDASAVQEALTAPFTTLVAWGVKGGFTAEVMHTLSATSHPILHRALKLLSAVQEQESASAELQARGGTLATVSQNAALPPGAVRSMQRAAEIALALHPPGTALLLELGKTAPMLPVGEGGEGPPPLILEVHRALAATAADMPSLIQSETEHEEAKEEHGGFADAWGAVDEDDFAQEDAAAPAQGAASDGLPGVLPPLATVQGQLLQALRDEYNARSAQYNESAVMHGLMPPPNAPQDGTVTHPLLHRPQAHAALLTAGHMAAGGGCVAQVAAMCALAPSDLQLLRPRISQVAAAASGLPEVQLSVPVSPTPPLLAAVAAAGSNPAALLGVIVPVLQAVCSSWNKAWAQRLEGLPRHLAALYAVRELRASVPLADLVGVSGASAAAGGGGAAGGDGGSVLDDGASVWSDASSVAGSVWSSASGASLASASSRSSARSAVTDASELLSVGSAASSRTASSARTDGIFSHTPSREFTNLTFDRGSGGFDKKAEAKKAQRKAAHRAKKAGARGRKDRGRTGSDRNQRSKESALLDALPDARWRLDTAELCGALEAAAAALRGMGHAYAPPAAALGGALASVTAAQAANMAAVAAMGGPTVRVPVPGVTRDSERVAHRADVGGHCPHSEPALRCFGAAAVAAALQGAATALGLGLAPEEMQSPHATDADGALQALGVAVLPLPPAHELAGAAAATLGL